MFIYFFIIPLTLFSLLYQYGLITDNEALITAYTLPFFPFLTPAVLFIPRIIKTHKKWKGFLAVVISLISLPFALVTLLLPWIAKLIARIIIAVIRELLKSIGIKITLDSDSLGVDSILRANGLFFVFFFIMGLGADLFGKYYATIISNSVVQITSIILFLAFSALVCIWFFKKLYHHLDNAFPEMPSTQLSSQAASNHTDNNTPSTYNSPIITNKNEENTLTNSSPISSKSRKKPHKGPIDFG